MLNRLYNLSILAYSALLFILAPFHKKANKWIAGRRNWVDKLRQERKTNEKWIWFHCSSLGEYEDCCEVFFAIQNENPEAKTLLTFFSPSGYEAMAKSKKFDLVMYLPVDRSSQVNLFLDNLKPVMVIVARSEIWLNYLREIKSREIPLFLIALKMDSKSGFLKFPKLYKNGFNAFTHIYCQDEKTMGFLKEHFQMLRCSCIGNTRFERIHKASFHNKEFPEIKHFIGTDPCIIAGSYLPRDLEKIRLVIPELLLSNIKIILVPHEIVSTEIRKLERSFGNQAISFSNISRLNDCHKILIIDHIGSLKHIYKYGDLAIIGGGFNRIGIHNIIEPAIYGLVTVFGPNHKNYLEAIDLLMLKAGYVYRDSDELMQIIRVVMDQSRKNTKIREQIKNYVLSNTTESKKVATHVQNQLKRFNPANAIDSYK